MSPSNSEGPKVLDVHDSTRISPRVRRRASKFDDDDDVESDQDDEESVHVEQEVQRKSPSVMIAPLKIPEVSSERLTNPLIEELSITHAQDFMRITDNIAYPSTDTFPIVYYARILGMDHVVSELLSSSGDESGIISTQQLLERLEQKSTPPKDPVFHSLPQSLNTPQNLLFWTTSGDEDDDTKLLDQHFEFDPAYCALLQGISERVPISIPQHTEVLQIPIPRNMLGTGCSGPSIPAKAPGILQQVSEVFSKYTNELELYSILPFESAQHDASAQNGNPATISTGWVATPKSNPEIHYRLTFHLEWLQTPSQPCLLLLVTELPEATAPLLVRIFLLALVVEQRLCAYAILPSHATNVAPFFRLTAVANQWICDFHKCSARYACLRYPTALSPPEPKLSSSISRRRLLVSLPENGSKSSAAILAGAKECDGTSVHLQYDTVSFELTGTKVPPSGTEDGTLPQLDILKDFELSSKEEKLDESADPIAQELLAKQAELETLEDSVEPSLRGLLSQVVRERLDHESGETHRRRKEERELQARCKSLVLRNKKREKDYVALDLEAVCDICADGEVEPDNSILFCEACNVAVHQYCYVVDEVPKGDYYCIPCCTLGRDKELPTLEPRPLPIACELCPIRDGAFVRTDIPGDPDRWVHVVCAKWHSLHYSNDDFDCVEDCTELKLSYRRMLIRCELCLGDRGAMVTCSGPNCDKHFHVTCARAVGTMRVTHGENCAGPIENGWRICCPSHSGKAVTKPTKRKEKSAQQLIEAAKQFPPEPRPPPVRVPFNQANGAERQALLALPDYEHSLMQELLSKRFFGVPCEICDIVDESASQVRCTVCGGTFCTACRIDADKINKQFYKCHGCAYVGARSDEDEPLAEKPQCIACHEEGGFLRPAFANPVRRKNYWKKYPKEKMRGLFGKKIWIHTVCNFWCPNVEFPTSTGAVDLSNLVLSQGKSLVVSKGMCILCGIALGIKVRCQYEGCEQPGTGEVSVMHVTCARQAGLEVRHDDGYDPPFYCRCYRHGGNCFNLRAKLEDLIEIERRRAGKDLERINEAMTLADAQRVFFAAIQVVKILGWAWRWAEWWVDFDSSWEPLIEEGQNEDSMTKEQLKIVESTRASRCLDARKCRLAPFGAAIRNREYDVGDDFNREALDRALRAVLHTKSLVGPLLDIEVDFFADWLGRAYRSKSRLLRTGADKMMVSEESSYCLHPQDHSLKFELRPRPLPGSLQQPRSVFDREIDEVDAFMQVPDSEIPTEEMLTTSSPKPKHNRRKKRSGSSAKPIPLTEPKKRKREQDSEVSLSQGALGKRPIRATKTNPTQQTPIGFGRNSRRSPPTTMISSKGSNSRKRKRPLVPDKNEPWVKPCARCKAGHKGGVFCRFDREHDEENFDRTIFDRSQHPNTIRMFKEYHGVAPVRTKVDTSQGIETDHEIEATGGSKADNVNKRIETKSKAKRERRTEVVPERQRALEPGKKPCFRCEAAKQSWEYCRVIRSHRALDFDLVSPRSKEEYTGSRKPCRRCHLADYGWEYCRLTAGHFSLNFDYTKFIKPKIPDPVNSSASPAEGIATDPKNELDSKHLDEDQEESEDDDEQEEPDTDQEEETETVHQEAFHSDEQEDSGAEPVSELEKSMYNFVKQPCLNPKCRDVPWYLCRLRRYHISRNVDFSEAVPPRKLRKVCQPCSTKDETWKSCRIRLGHTDQNYDGTPFVTMDEDGNLVEIGKSCAAIEKVETAISTPSRELSRLNDSLSSELPRTRSRKKTSRYEESSYDVNSSDSYGVGVSKRQRRNPPTRLNLVGPKTYGMDTRMKSASKSSAGNGNGAGIDIDGSSNEESWSEHSSNGTLTHGQVRERGIADGSLDLAGERDAVDASEGEALLAKSEDEDYLDDNNPKEPLKDSSLAHEESSKVTNGFTHPSTLEVETPEGVGDHDGNSSKAATASTALNDEVSSKEANKNTSSGEGASIEPVSREEEEDEDDDDETEPAARRDEERSPSRRLLERAAHKNPEPKTHDDNCFEESSRLLPARRSARKKKTE